MMVASHSTVPSIERLLPKPAFVTSLSSSTLIAISTASTALAPLFKKVIADLAALDEYQRIVAHAADGRLVQWKLRREPFRFGARNLLFTCGQVDLFILKAVIACASVNEYSTNIPREAAALRHVRNCKVDRSVELSIGQTLQARRAFGARYTDW